MLLIRKQLFNRFLSRNFVNPSSDHKLNPHNPNLQLVVDLRGTKAVLPPRAKKGGSEEQLKSRDPSVPQSPEAIALVLALLPSDWRSVHPGIMGEMLAMKIKDAEKSDSSDIVKPIVSDLVEYLATQDLTYTGHILYYFLTKFGPISVSQLMRGALTTSETIFVLSLLARQDEWRKFGVMDLAIELMSDSSTADIMQMLSLLPAAPVNISETKTEQQSPAEQNEAVNGGVVEIDFEHPSSLWGYKKRTKELENAEEKIDRMTKEVTSITYTTSGHTRKSYSDASQGVVMLVMPYTPHTSEWFPEEIGAMIGRLFADEWELDYITYLLIDFVTLHFSKRAKDCSWRDFMGYVGIILSSAMAVNRHWENEDIVWVYKDFCHDVGKWAFHTWPEYREMEHREWLADVISLVASKRNIADHDTKLISSIMDEVCEEWDYERTDYLGFMIQARMQERSFPFKQKNDVLAMMGMKKAKDILIQEYYIAEEWSRAHDRLLSQAKERLAQFAPLEDIQEFHRIQSEALAVKEEFQKKLDGSHDPAGLIE